MICAESSAGEALSLIAERPDIDLLLTDIIMPEIYGRKLAEMVQPLRPDFPVLYSTGFTRDAVAPNGILEGDVELIGKPFTLDALATKVRQVLDKGVRS